MSSRFSTKQGLLPRLHRQGSRPEHEYHALWRSRTRWITILSIVCVCLMMGRAFYREDSKEHHGEESKGSGGERYDGRLVLAVATNTTAERVAVFVQSWAQYAPGNRIVLFTEPEIHAEAGMSAFLKDYNVDVIQVDRPREIDDVDDEEEVPKPGRLALEGLRKVLHYMQRYTSQSSNKGIALVLSAGDVVLQGYPFGDTSVKQYIPRQGLVFALQGGPQLGAVKVSQCDEVWRGVRDCFGSSMAERVGRLNLINGHVVLGAQKGMVEFLLLVVDVLATRTRERCLSHHRADLAAIQYSVGEFGRDPRNVDFEFSLRDHVTSTVYGVLYGLPAKIDTKGILRRRPPEGGVRRGPTPTIISQYSTNAYLLEMYTNRFRDYARESVGFDGYM